MGSETPTTPPVTPAEHASLKARLAKFFRESGHVAEAGIDAAAEGAVAVVFAGRFGE